jgi:hypothetical protein
MKTRILTLVLGGLMVSATSSYAETFTAKPLPSVTAAQNPTFGVLRTHRQAKGITATWSMTGLDGVVCFTVQRTYEDPTDQYAYWEELSVLPCNGARSFSYTDKEVFPGIINYRIAALMQDGSIIYSGLSSVRIVSRK